MKPEILWNSEKYNSTLQLLSFHFDDFEWAKAKKKGKIFMTYNAPNYYHHPVHYLLSELFQNLLFSFKQWTDPYDKCYAFCSQTKERKAAI